MKKLIFATMSLVLASAMVQAADRSVPDTSPAMEPSGLDNSQVNKRDRENQTLTPLDQSNAKADLSITQAIRKSIMKQHLSVDAKNIKIITSNGDVTLRGPVQNISEKEKIDKIAKSVAGIKTLNNQLEVK